jgi:hypothetical protein
MHKEEGLTPAERELESALGRLKPAASTLNRDELMFNAGRAAAGRARPWQILSVVLMALMLCSVLIRPDIYGPQESSRSHDPEQLRITQITYQPVQTESPGSLVYPTLRRDIVRYGLDAWLLRQDISSSAQHKNRKQWLESILSS